MPQGEIIFLQFCFVVFETFSNFFPALTYALFSVSEGISHHFQFQFRLHFRWNKRHFVSYYTSNCVKISSTSICGWVVVLQLYIIYVLLFCISKETFVDCQLCTSLPEAEWCINASVNFAIIVLDNGLLPEWHLAIIWTNAGILLIGPLWTSFSDISLETHTFSFN